MVMMLAQALLVRTQTGLTHHHDRLPVVPRVGTTEALARRACWLYPVIMMLFVRIITWQVEVYCTDGVHGTPSDCHGGMLHYNLYAYKHRSD